MAWAAISSLHNVCIGALPKARACIVELRLGLRRMRSMKIHLHLTIPLIMGLISALSLDHDAAALFNPVQNRQPAVIQLIIPAGTAARVAQGGDAPSIPADMAFLRGDTLRVVNQDSVSHQLGPLFIPPGAAASLSLNVAKSYTFLCTFKHDQYLGLNVYEPVNIPNFLLTILTTGLPLAGLFALISFLPLRGGARPMSAAHKP
jgi:hypothetical protein